MKISAVIITFNEAKNINRCLLSLQGIADEILVVDSNSTDDTVNICKEMGAKTVLHTFEGYGPQKQFAVDLAQYDMILSLDADEELSQELKISIEKVKTSGTEYAAYDFNRLNFYCGRPIRFCGWYPDCKIRMFNRKVCGWDMLSVHEVVEAPAGEETRHLKGDLNHYTYISEEQHYLKMRHYAELASIDLKKRNKKKMAMLIYLKTAFRFFNTFLIKLGLLDGIYGYKISLAGAKYVYWKYTLASKV